MKTGRPLNRRNFLSSSLAGTAVGMTVLSASVQERVPGSNDRIRLASIGVGGQGRYHLRRMAEWAKYPNAKIAIPAVCDCWEKRRQEAREMCQGEAYADYRRILDRKDVDAVVIATPDHWHSKMAIDAMEAGKDVYCEKPVTLTWQQARDVARTAKRTGRVFQCGAQSASGEMWWQAQKLIREGLIGKPIWTQGGAYRNDPKGDWNWEIDPSANPSNLDWDMWLGWRWKRAPKRPWDAERFFRFRKFWDYSTGLAGDLLYHSLSHLLIAVGPDFPSRVTATGGNYVFGKQNDNREVPDNFFVTIDYPAGHTILLPATQVNESGLPDTIRGQHATMTFEAQRGILVHPERPFADAMEEKRKSGKFPEAKTFPCEEGQRRLRPGQKPPEPLTCMEFPVVSQRDHMQNFLDCMRTREKPTLNADLAYQVMVAIGLSVEAYRRNRIMRFDPKRETVI